MFAGIRSDQRAVCDLEFAEQFPISAPDKPWRCKLRLPLFSYLLLRSRLYYRRGEVSWKGRGYDPRGAFQAGHNRSPGEPGKDGTTKHAVVPENLLSSPG